MPRNKTMLTLMCGLARCGKSTWIKQNKGDAVVVCPDTIRSEILGHQFHKSAEDFVWAIAKSMVRILLDQKKSVIIDATNLTFFSRGDWIRIANEYGAKVRIVWIKTSIRECKRRNRKSTKGNKLPSEVIDRMASVFENPYYGKEKGKPRIELIELPRNKAGRLKDDLLDNYYQAEAVERGRFK